MKPLFHIEKAHGTLMKWAVVDKAGNVVQNFKTRDETRKYLNRAPSKKSPSQICVAA